MDLQESERTAQQALRKSEQMKEFSTQEIQMENQRNMLALKQELRLKDLERDRSEQTLKSEMQEKHQA